MDARFVRKWRQLEAERAAGVPFDRVLARADASSLVEALAAAASEDPVAANAIATRLLNVMRRLRLVAVAMGVAALLITAVLLDGYATGAWGVLEGGSLTLVLGVVALALGVGAVIGLTRIRLGARGEPSRPERGAGE